MNANRFIHRSVCVTAPKLWINYVKQQAELDANTAMGRAFHPTAEEVSDLQALINYNKYIAEIARGINCSLMQFETFTKYTGPSSTR